MESIVCKFGGTSLANAEQIQKVRGILDTDPRRKFVVPSAPGKRDSDDTKITDLLYLCHELSRQKLEFSDPFSRIRQRYTELVDALQVELDMDQLLDELEKQIAGGSSTDYVASRGEYLCGRILADLLDATFIDPGDAILFTSGGELDVASYKNLAACLAGEGLYVIPGFYGKDASGEVKTFSRGGSDITGSIVARAVRAKVYENWTDVSGMLMADPRLIPNARPVREITYREIRELSYMGASVFHDEAMFPVREANIPVNIRNTDRPEDPGTMILPTRTLTTEQIVGVAGRPACSMLFIEKAMMNQERGFGRRVLEIVASHEISYEHTPSGIDTMSVIIRDEELDGKGDALLVDIERVLQPDRAELIPGLALIATVGEGMSHRVGIAARLFGALAEARVNVRVIDQGASEINIIVGVEEADYESAVKAIYNAFVDEAV
jgi:aspartate kinase